MNATCNKIGFGLVLCLLLMALLGASNKANALTQPFVKATGQATVYTVQGTVGDALLLTLPTNPSTGFGWQVESLPSNLQLQERQLVEQPVHHALQNDALQGTKLTGAPQQELLIFRAHTKGQATVVLSYRRAWEQGVAPIRYTICLVDVR